MRNYFGCNDCGHFFLKGWHRKSDNAILKTPTSKEQRQAMIWWNGAEELRPLKERIEEGYIADCCDKCKAFVNSIIEMEGDSP